MNSATIILIIAIYFLALYIISYQTGKDDSNNVFFNAGRDSKWYVVAFGMVGAFLNKKIQDLVLKKNISFWLKWENKSIIKRLKNYSKRPMLKNMNNEKLINLINDRSKIYSKSNYILECENLGKPEIVNKIIKIYETK